MQKIVIRYTLIVTCLPAGRFESTIHNDIIIAELSVIPPILAFARKHGGNLSLKKDAGQASMTERLPYATEIKSLCIITNNGLIH